MARDENRIGKFDSWVSVGQWTYDKVAALYVLLATGGAALTSSFAAIFAGWTPFEWACLGLGTAIGLYLLLKLGSAIGAWDIHRRATAQLLERTRQGSPINPLDAVYTNQTIRLDDLLTPAGATVYQKTFIGCDLIGPAPMILSGSTVDIVLFGNVEAVSFDGTRATSVPNKVFFSRCNFQSCRIFNTVLMVPEEMADGFRAAYPMVPWMN